MQQPAIKLAERLVNFQGCDFTNIPDEQLKSTLKDMDSTLTNEQATEVLNLAKEMVLVPSQPYNKKRIGKDYDPSKA